MLLRRKIKHSLKLFLGRGVPKSIFVRSGSISEFRTHDYHKTARNLATNPMGPVPAPETLSFFFLSVRLEIWIRARNCPPRTLQTQNKPVNPTSPRPEKSMKDVPDQDSVKKSDNTNLNLILLTRAIPGIGFNPHLD